MHELKEPDKEKRLQYFRRFTHFIRGGIDILDEVCLRDETWFHLSEYVNNQNSRIWSAENPYTFHETPLHSFKVRVCCAVSRRRIIGPIFFSETITAERYQELIMNFISLLEAEEQDCWFQQMGLRRIQQIQQCRCCVSYLVVTLLLETCGPLDPRICHHCIFIFGGFWRRTLTKTTRTHQKNWNRYWAVHFKRHCRNSSQGRIVHEEKSECMHRWKRWTFPALNITLFFVFWF
jgi:hypothetical protein